jgi:hypothetical protein
MVDAPVDGHVALVKESLITTIVGSDLAFEQIQIDCGAPCLGCDSRIKRYLDSRDEAPGAERNACECVIDSENNHPARTCKTLVCDKISLLVISDVISDIAAPGELVLDPYIGAGTTRLACQHTGRV